MFSFNRAWAREEVRYLIIGIWNTFFAMLTFMITLALFENVCKVWQILTISSAIGISQSFATQRKFVWRSANNARNEFLKFFAISTLQYLANLVSLQILTQRWGWPVLISQVVLTSILIGITFVVLKLWVFSSNSESTKVVQWTEAAKHTED